MCIDVNEIPYSFYYSPMHAGNAFMVRAGACAYVFLSFGMCLPSVPSIPSL